MQILYLVSEARLADAQEWAAHNGVPVPHKEGRVNNSLLYKGMEEDTPTNILQVQSRLSWFHSNAATFCRLLRPFKDLLCCSPNINCYTLVPACEGVASL